MIIEQTIIDYLSAVLQPPVSGEVPADPPETFITVEKLGGGQRNFIATASVAIQSYGPSEADAAALNDRVKAAMANLIQLDDVSSCSLDSDYNFTDTTRKQNRYRAVFNVVYFAE